AGAVHTRPRALLKRGSEGLRGCRPGPPANPPATGRSAIPPARNSSYAAARRSPACPIARTIPASPTSPPPTAGARRRSRKGGEALRVAKALSSLRKQGPITTGWCCRNELELQPSQNRALWLWIPDRARFARLSGTTASLLFHLSNKQPCSFSRRDFA